MSMNFEDYQKDAKTWLHQLCDYLGIDDEQKAGRIFKAVLHAIRDRIPSGEAVHLAAQLPVIWKGIYFDGFTLHNAPVRIRDEEQWLEFIRSKDAFAANADFPTLDHTYYAFQDVMNFLRDHISEGQYNQIAQALHSEIEVPA
ncbi:DUF2267 domain-containing protein [Pontibacter silvestris]|uniref:DUF2267 domain-containing protein n=1 Tax=Pontibacter silvestris TaxID=2305183 RepID=A0ABW4WSX0_9BACT|nr:DUF2267 domain-containing protein [Pontibacter silvestris]MCC9138611.1 DUF2267 domain-containing protein [Pontibacter silvestris]